METQAQKEVPGSKPVLHWLYVLLATGKSQIFNTNSRANTGTNFKD